MIGFEWLASWSLHFRLETLDDLEWLDSDIDFAVRLRDGELVMLVPFRERVK